MKSYCTDWAIKLRNCRRYCGSIGNKVSSQSGLTTVDNEKATQVGLGSHINDLSIDRESSGLTLSDVKIAFLLRCRKVHPLCGGSRKDYEQLKKSYAIVAAHVSGGHVLDFDPGECATEMYYNTREVKELRTIWTSSVLLIILIAFLALHICMAVVTYQKQAEALGKYRNHIAADTMKPWWGNAATYEQGVKRRYIEQWKKVKSGAQQHRIEHIGTVKAASGHDDSSIIHPSSEHIENLRQKVEKAKAM